MNGRILVVEEEEPMLLALTEYFAALGCDVEGVRGIDEAEDLLDDSSFAVVLADLRLAGWRKANGFEGLDLLRRKCPRASIVLLTSYGSSEIEREARNHGVAAVLTKPKPLPDLAQLVFSYLEEEP